jgi:preprotein translocase subunit SecB
MAEATGNGEAPAQQAQPPRTQILGQFIRDLSFENVAAQKGAQGQTQPEITVQVGLDARKRAAENQYDVITKLNVTSKSAESGETIFLLELDYAGIFKVENVPQEQLHPYLMIECPRMIFPFLRRVVSDITRDGGFPPLNLDTIDFLDLYRQQIAARAQAQKAQAGGEGGAGGAGGADQGEAGGEKVN